MTPTPIYLAEVIEADPASGKHHIDAATELRRLHAENEVMVELVEELLAERNTLLEALKMVKKTVEENEQGVSGEDNYTYPYKVWTEAVREAIAKVEGESA